MHLRLLLLACLVPACVGDTSTTTPDAGPDATSDAPIDTGLDASTDTSTEATVDAGTVYNDIKDATRWETLDLAALTGGVSAFIGGTFDGKYVYFAPGNGATPSGLVARFDSTKTFVTASWEKFDLTAKDATFAGFEGAVYDGKSVYFIPYNNPSFVGYDTTQPFNSQSSYTGYNLVTQIDANAKQFSPGAYDGKYVYMTPYFGGVAVRYDTAAVINATGSYEKYQAFSPNTYGYNCAIYDGKYVYYVPYAGPVLTSYSGLVRRYDTSKAFSQATSWLTYDVANVDQNAVAFNGVVFDGRYLYFAPSQHSVALRYDTQAQFDTIGSWLAFDLSNVNAGATKFAGGTFDGRYVYFAPAGGGVTVRYDTQQPFASAGSWSSFDITTKSVDGHGFLGMVFDGRWVYYVPYAKTVAVRFDAKSPPSVPAFHSSFY